MFMWWLLMLSLSRYKYMLKPDLFDLEYVMLWVLEVEYFYPSGPVLIFHVIL